MSTEVHLPQRCHPGCHWDLHCTPYLMVFPLQLLYSPSCPQTQAPCRTVLQSVDLQKHPHHFWLTQTILILISVLETLMSFTGDDRLAMKFIETSPGNLIFCCLVARLFLESRSWYKLQTQLKVYEMRAASYARMKLELYYGKRQISIGHRNSKFVLLQMT